MPRYCVDAWVTFDAWKIVEADTPEDALEQARSLTARDFELGEALDVDIESAMLDA